MTYAKKTLSEIKLIHGNYGNFIKGQKLDKKKEKKYKMPPYQDLAASNEIDDYDNIPVVNSKGKKVKKIPGANAMPSGGSNKSVNANIDSF